MLHGLRVRSEVDRCANIKEDTAARGEALEQVVGRVKEIHGDTIADVLSYVEYQPKEMALRYRNTAERAVKEGRITARERQLMLKTYNASMQGYTYYERDE